MFKENNIDVLNKIIKGKINKEILEKIKHFNLDEKEYKKMEDIVEMLRNETEHYETAEKVGIIKGRKEGKLEEKSQIAKNMLNSNMPIKLVSKFK